MMMMCGGVCYIGGDKIFSRFTDFWSEIDGEREKGSSIINLSVYHFFFYQSALLIYFLYFLLKDLCTR